MSYYQKHNYLSFPSFASIAFRISALIFLSFSMGCTQDSIPPTKAVSILFEENTPTSEVIPNITNTPTATMLIVPPEVSPYVDVIVESVEIRILGTSPQQIELLIKGTLPDQCNYVFYALENRGDKYVKVSLKGKHPPDTSCGKEQQVIEYPYLLGQNLPESKRGFGPGTYQLVVNNYQTTFVIE